MSCVTNNYQKRIFQSFQSIFGKIEIESTANRTPLRGGYFYQVNNLDLIIMPFTVVNLIHFEELVRVQAQVVSTNYTTRPRRISLKKSWKVAHFSQGKKRTRKISGALMAF